MIPYVYQPLDAAREEIRVLILQPGTGDDAIHISISHVPFQPQPEHTAPRLSLKEIKESLPQEWFVANTLEGRRFFTHSGYQGGEYIGRFSSWTHPDPVYEQQHHDGINPSQPSAVDIEFEALSYTWGNVSGLIDITVIPTTARSAEASLLAVTTNLYQALVHLRKPNQTRVLWIDAICINQKDTSERSSQVQRMHLLYKHASRVVIWLGTSTEDSELALRTLEYEGQQVELTDFLHSVPAPDAKESNWEAPPKPRSAEVQHAIRQVSQNPYFERLWIIPEIQNANENAVIQCGKLSVRWYHFRRAVFMRETGHPLNVLVTDLKATGLESLHALSMSAGCTEPRDRIYAMLGLFPQAVAKLIEPRYDLSIGDIYKQTILAIIKATRRINIGLGDEDVATNYYYNRNPSWTPPLSSGDDLAYRSLFIECSYASGVSSASVVYVPPNELSVHGVFCDTIAAVTGTMGPFYIENGLRDAWRFWLFLSECIGFVTRSRKTDTEVANWFVWTITMGQLFDRFPIAPYQASLDEAKALFERLRYGDTSTMHGKIGAWVETMVSRAAGRRFFRTGNGQAGLCDRRAQRGDIISVLLGHDYPMLLRPTPEGGKYRILSRCYMHGIMDAEALLGPIPVPWEPIVNYSQVHADKSEWRLRNRQTGEITTEDPRLGPLPPEWEPIEMEDEMRLSWEVQHYRHRITGEVINSDPRMLPEALEARGVRLETICLI